jgi:ribulose kinase
VAVNPGPHPTAIAAAVGHPVTAVQAHAVVAHGTSAIASAPRATVHPQVEQRWQKQQQRTQVRADREQLRAQRQQDRERRRAMKMQKGKMPPHERF